MQTEKDQGYRGPPRQISKLSTRLCTGFVDRTRYD